MITELRDTHFYTFDLPSGLREGEFNTKVC